MYGDNLYGQISYGLTDQDEESSGDHFINFSAYLPEFYQNMEEIIDLQTVLGYKAGKVVYDLEDLPNQCFIVTATWGLDRLEKIFGLNTDKSKAYVRRREIVLAKLRGTGSTTKEMIQNVAMAFSGGEVDIQEYPEEYSFVVQFIGVKGIPQNMAGLMNAIEEIKPAHLAYSFKYTYTTWNALQDMRWSDASQKTWNELKIYEGE